MYKITIIVHYDETIVLVINPVIVSTATMNSRDDFVMPGKYPCHIKKMREAREI